MRAGLPIRAGLLRLKERLSGKEISVLSEQVNAGERLGEAFTAANFSAFECHLVTAGERSAQLDTVFEHLAEFWKLELEMRQALIRPLIYPLVVLHFAVVVLAVVEYVTAPNPSLPLVMTHFFFYLGSLYGLGFIIYQIVRTTWSNPGWRGFWLYLPIIGSSLQTASAYRWITALRLEFGAGISLSRAVGDAWRASGYIGCERLAEEGEQAMREGKSLSTLVQSWRQLPRDWVDFIETGELSGAFEAAFKNLEAEAARSWKLAQERMAEWVPKIAYFVVLLFVAAVVGKAAYNMEIAPIVNAEKQIDDATK